MTAPLHAPVFGPDVQDRLLAEFHRAADHVPAYRTLLDEQRVAVAQVRDVRTFSRLCPLLSRRNTFDRFPLAQMSVGGELRDVADVLTSSGHGGRFSFGVISRKEASAGASFIDAAFDAAFAVKSKATLVVNCLPMGVVFASHCMTVATTSVREDMAVALVQTFGDRYQQIVLVGDPLFMKRLTDHAIERAVDWRRHRINVILGEEVFGEHFRSYVAQCLGLDLERPADGYIMSSLGVAELGLHLGFETPATIALRRRAVGHAAFARDLLGRDSRTGLCLPVLFAFNPQRTFIEIIDPDVHGYGKMAVSMLDPDRSVPLLRYQTGDVARLLDRDHVDAMVRRHRVQVGEVPVALLALQGRDREALPNGSQVGFYKDALYANHQIARCLTGALRLIFAGRQCTMHVQLVKGQAPDAAMERALLREMAFDVRPARLVLWPYAAFPFGMGLDYERKFSHFVPGELVA
jgi:phenylacetate-coenzyme A ligase PaaK-like adenylate-forming protein